MKKTVIKVDLHDDRAKSKALRAVSGLPGVESVSVDMKDQKLTLIGNTDPVCVVGKLKKLCHPTIVSVGPAKEEKKQEPKKEEPKKQEEKKKDPNENLAELVKKAYEAHWCNMMMSQPYPYPCYYVEENPNACVIC